MPSPAFYPLSLHDALPISGRQRRSGRARAHPDRAAARGGPAARAGRRERALGGSGAAHAAVARRPDLRGGRAARASRGGPLASDRKSTRLNSSHTVNSYAVARVLPSFPTRRSSDLWSSTTLGSCPRASRSSGRAGRSCCSSGSARTGSGRVWRGPRGGCTPAGPTGRSSCSSISGRAAGVRSEEHTSELQSHSELVCRRPRSTLFPYTTLFRSLVVNDARVVPARIPIERPRGEVLLLERVGENGLWEGLARPTRRLHAGRTYGEVELLEHLGEGRWRQIGRAHV